MGWRDGFGVVAASRDAALARRGLLLVPRGRRKALTACRRGDTLVVTELDRLRGKQPKLSPKQEAHLVEQSLAPPSGRRSRDRTRSRSRRVPAERPRAEQRSTRRLPRGDRLGHPECPEEVADRTWPPPEDLLHLVVDAARDAVPELAEYRDDPVRQPGRQTRLQHGGPGGLVGDVHVLDRLPDHRGPALGDLG